MSDELDRISEAVIDVVLERGHEAASIAAVAARAGLSEVDFKRHFPSFETAALAVYWRHTDEFNARLRAAYDRHQSWRDSLRAAAYAAARYVRDNPRVVRFGTIEMLQSGTMAQVERERHLQSLVDLIDAGRQEMDDPESLDRSVAEATFGAIYELLVRELQKGRGTRRAAEFVPELMYVAVRPYLGEEAAREELKMPPAAHPRHADIVRA